MRKIVFLILLVKTVYGQTIPNSVTIQKDLRVQGKTVLGGVSKVEDITMYADTIFIGGLDGTGSILGIDVNGDVTRVTGAGDGGVTGLTPSEVLFGGGDGTIAQMPEFYWHPTNQTLLIQGLDNKKSLDLPGTTSQGINIGNQGIYSSDEFGIYDNDISDPLFLWLPTPNQIRIGYANGINYDRDNNRIGLGTSTLTQDLNIAADTILLSTIDGTGTFLKIDGSGNVTKGTEAGLGTVTSFSFTDGSGFDGTVTNATTTPTLELTTTVGDNRVMYSNSGAITGSGLFTYDDLTDNEHFDITVLEFDVVGTSSYPYSLFNISDNANVSICDYNGNANGTYGIFDDATQLITLSANNGIVVNQFSALGQNLVYSNNSGILGLVTLSDFTLSGGALSITSGAIVNADINASAAIDASKIGGGGVSTTEFDYLGGVTSDVQTQLDARSKVVATSHLTSQNAAIAATTLYSVPADGFYTISVQIAVTTTGGTSIGTQIRFTNVADNVVKTMPSNNANGLNQCASTTTANAVCYTITAYCKSGTNIQYITNLAGSGQVYSLDAQVVKD